MSNSETKIEASSVEGNIKITTTNVVGGDTTTITVKEQNKYQYLANLNIEKSRNQQEIVKHQTRNTEIDNIISEINAL